MGLALVNHGVDKANVLVCLQSFESEKALVKGYSVHDDVLMNNTIVALVAYLV